MSKTYVIPWKYMPRTLPIFQTMTVWLLLDRLKAPGLVWGALIMLFSMWWIIQLIAVFEITEPSKTFKLED